MTVIDRFEGDAAVCDDGADGFTVARSALPADAAEGDVIIPAGDGGFIVDAAATQQRRAAMKSRLFALAHKSHITEK